MNKSMTSLVCALAVSGCANATQNFYIQQFIAVDCAGDPKADEYVSSGALDVAAGGAQFFAVAYVTTLNAKASPGPLELGAHQLESENRNRPVLTKQVVNYRLSKRLGATPKAYVTALAIPFIDDEAFASVQLISPELATLLFDSLTPTNELEDFVDITAEVELTGVYDATQSPFSTGVFEFPIRAYRSNPVASCTAPSRFVRTDTALCRYIGQTNNLSVLAPPPTNCCTPGTTGC